MTLDIDGWYDDLTTAGDLPLIDNQGGGYKAADYNEVGQTRHQRLQGGLVTIQRAVFGPSPLADAATWTCLWLAHALYGVGNNWFYNNPPTSSIYSGSFACAPADAITIVGGGGDTDVDASWSATTTSGDAHGTVGAGAMYIDFGAIVRQVLADHPDPSLGYTIPQYLPYGFTVEWEFPDPEVVSVELSPDEPTSRADTNTGSVTWYAQSSTEAAFGPVAGSNNWRAGGTTIPGTRIADYSGGDAPWYGISPDLGSVEDPVVVPYICVITDAANGTEPGSSGGAARNKEWLAVRVTLRARRYRIVSPGLPPPIRLYPRDDELGAPTSSRIYPSTKRPRTAGGYQ